MTFEYDVCIVGTGRVGLPLGLAFIDAGLNAVGVNIDAQLREMVNAGKMPFLEPGFDELIQTKKFHVHADHAVVGRARSVVITVGTPLHNHIETDLSQVRRVLEDVVPHLKEGQLVCLRSTVAPGTTQYVKRWIERNSPLRVGETIFVSFSPERIAEGKAFRELRELPQVVGADDPRTRELAGNLFSTLGVECLHTDCVSAELVKLFNNISRYVHFALANQFALIADTFDTNVHEIRRLANYKYPRNPIAMPGLTAGTCLRKDFGMINEWAAYPDMLLSAWKMNEYMPAFLVQHMKKRAPIHNRKIAILGYTFKAETDDIRDSLAPKLLRYVEREMPRSIMVNDPHLPNPIVDPYSGGTTHPNSEVDKSLEGADAVFVATNHSIYRAALQKFAAANPEAWIADIWDVCGLEKIFYRGADIVPPTSPST